MESINYNTSKLLIYAKVLKMYIKNKLFKFNSNH